VKFTPFMSPSDGPVVLEELHRRALTSEPHAKLATAIARSATLAKKRPAALSPWSSNFKVSALAKSTANFVVSYNTVEVRWRWCWCWL
jgi:hypothetical protein